MRNGRPVFTILGKHPLLHILRDRLIRAGLVFQGTWVDADFLLVGGEDRSLGVYNIPTTTPVVLLSSDAVYSDRDVRLQVRDKAPMKEEDPAVVISMDSAALKSLTYLTTESIFLLRGNTLVLRVFNVYGPDITEGLIPDYLKKAKLAEPLPMFSPGYHVRTYLHQTDFFGYFDALMAKFLKGLVGVYNIGSEEEISAKRLADSIWQLKHGTAAFVPTTMEYATKWHRWWVIPDMTRTKAVTGYRTRITLRTGLWEMTQGAE